MGSRLFLQALLEELCPNVYFQPPASKTMVYPCIVYSREDRATAFADNMPYRITKQYQVTVMDRDPDSDIPDKVARLPRCTQQRTYAADNLNHDVFVLYHEETA